MSQANVKVVSSGIGGGSVLVDGREMSSIISGVTIKVAAGEATQVDLLLAVPSIESLDLSGADVSIGGVAMPVSVEMALYRHLTAKHGPLE